MPVARLTGIARFDLRWAIGGGMVLAGLGTLWLASRVTTQSDLSVLAWPLLVIGTGSAFVYSPLLVATMRAVPHEAGAKASSFIVLCFQLGGSISSASIVAFLDQRLQFHQTILAAQMTLSRLPVVQFLQHNGPAALAAQVAAQSSALAYADAFVVAGIFALVVSPAVLLLARKKT